MNRLVIEKLIKWKNNPEKQPLLIRGARQIGKTYVVREFAKKYFKNYIEINFERDRWVKGIFYDDLSPKRILSEIEIGYHKSISDLNDTLIFFDEIQECKEAITSLKYFSEEIASINLIAAGSLLGVSLIRNEVSFPVGKVDSINMFPINFEEYLLATNNERLRDLIFEKFKTFSPLDEVLHNVAIKEYRKFLALGGMPRPLQIYIDTNSYLKADSILKNIFLDYLDDMEKYTSTNESIKIKNCYNSIPKQLGKENKNFKYSEIQKGKDKKYFGNSIHWLTNSNVVLRVNNTETPRVPLEFHKDENNFRIYMADHGMLRSKAKIPIENIIQVDYVDDMIGMLVENYVACEFASKNIPLYFWRGKKQYEIEFLIEENNNVIPVEVKNSKRVISKSLCSFLEQYNSPYAYRISMKNFRYENKIKSVPLYAVWCIKHSSYGKR